MTQRRCERCGIVEEWTDAEELEAMKEFKDRFGEPDIENMPGGVARVCDRCYAAIMKWILESERRESGGTA